MGEMEGVAFMPFPDIPTLSPFALLRAGFAPLRFIFI
jgi:hypothetical protein